MLFPFSILLGAIAAAGAVAFGNDPRWMIHAHGLEMIMLSRRLQGPLVAGAMLACAAVVVMVVAGRWRAWWLLGLAPVLGLFARHFAFDPAGGMIVNAAPSFVAANDAKFVADDDEVVGVSFDGEQYALPYGILYQSPVVALSEPRRRLLVMWSAFANRAVAEETDWTLKPRELEVVSEPANSLLLYNTGLGQFIVGVTGLTPDGARPTGFLAPVPTEKMPWSVWRRRHPDTLVLSPPDGWRTGWPTKPVPPRYPMPGELAGAPTDTWAKTGIISALVQMPQPTLLKDADLTGAPLNLLVGSSPLLVYRDGEGETRAFIRQANGDLTPRFYPVSNPAHPTAMWTERDSNSLWAVDGRAIDGALKGEKLEPVVVDDGVYEDVIRFWYPSAIAVTPTAADIGTAPVTMPNHATRRRIRTKPKVVGKQVLAKPARPVQVTASF
ncbi:MAG: DUF3179 domain-containing (seleno)protein [Tepidisphaeraceae bacterium]|jgi:hypothetical protein